MQIVTKQKNRDCGICVLASIFDVGWWLIAAVIFKPGHKRRSYGTKTRQLIHAARCMHKNTETGFTKTIVTCGKNDRLLPWPKKNGEIKLENLKINTGAAQEQYAVCKIPHLRGKKWHWVIWDGSRIIDPQQDVIIHYESYVGRMPTSYFLIELP